MRNRTPFVLAVLVTGLYVSQVALGAQQAGKPGNGKKPTSTTLSAIAIFTDVVGSDRYGSENLGFPGLVPQPAYIDGIGQDGTSADPIEVTVFGPGTNPNFVRLTFPGPTPAKGKKNPGSPGTDRQVFVDLSAPVVAGGGLGEGVHPFDDPSTGGVVEEAALIRPNRFQGSADDCTGTNAPNGLTGLIPGEDTCVRLSLRGDTVADPNEGWLVDWSLNFGGAGVTNGRVTCLEDRSASDEFSCDAWLFEPDPYNNGDGVAIVTANEQSAGYFVPFKLRVCLADSFTVTECGQVALPS